MLVLQTQLACLTGDMSTILQDDTMHANTRTRAVYSAID
jgi:hypothetical protein